MSHPSHRQIAGWLLLLLAVGLAIAGVTLGPWTAVWWRGPIGVDHVVPHAWFSGVALGGAAALAWIGLRLPRWSPSRDRVVLLFVVVLGLLLGERMLLMKLGLPLWRHDPELQWVHRPGAVRSLVGYGRPDAVIAINRRGHHDVEIAEAPADGERRGLAIGDSVTFGTGVTRDEAWPTRVERLLAPRRVELVNTGVSGYGTSQMAPVLEREAHLAPEFAVVAVCPNDLTEPFTVDPRLGGDGLDYHGIAWRPDRVTGWLLNETGLGRLAVRIRAGRDRP